MTRWLQFRKIIQKKNDYKNFIAELKTERLQKREKSTRKKKEQE